VIGDGHLGLAARRTRGMTLVEVLVVVVIVALISGSMIAGSGQLGGARLKRASAMIVGAVRAAFTRSTAVSKSVRLAFDLDHHTVNLEEADQPMLVQRADESLGADPATEAQKQAYEEGQRVLAGLVIPRPKFKPAKAAGFEREGQGAGRPLGRGIVFKQVQTAHDDTPKSEGVAYLHFWPGGQTERATIQIKGEKGDDASGLTLIVSPLTGKVSVHPGTAESPWERLEAEREDADF
jgi:general secretion pathway protein H